MKGRGPSLGRNSANTTWCLLAFSFSITVLLFILCPAVCVSVYEHEDRCLWKTEKEIGIPVAEAAGGCELPKVDAWD